MPRRPLHDTDAILDAARALVLDGGPRAASVAAIGAASGAPVGSLYHRFGSRDGLLTRVWVRAIERFQAAWVAPLEGPGDAVERGAAMAAAALRFADTDPEDARLLLAVRPADLLDGPRDELDARVAQANAGGLPALRSLTRQLTGGTRGADVERVAFAVVDLPHGTARRHGGPVPDRVVTQLQAAATALLRAVGDDATT